MVATFAEFVSRTLPLTVGNGKPVYRLPFISSSNPSEELSKLANNTQNAYQINPYMGDPVHELDKRA